VLSVAAHKELFSLSQEGEMKTLLITGGAGFIGSNFVKYMLEKHTDYSIVVLDKLTYAGNPENLAPCHAHPRFSFIKGDICDVETVDRAAKGVHCIVNFAAETHVDRSITKPDDFIRTDILGTHVLLEAARKYAIERYVQISTDEVYGSIEQGSFTEDSPLRPSSPYAASKAGGDLLVHSYWVTHKLPVLITRSSNNYGPNQYPEKVIPLFITNALEDKPLPLYGDGRNVRDWLYVRDNCAAIDLILHHGQPGEIYNVGAGEERMNIELTRAILRILGKPESLITFVTDRKGHDRRYSIESSKVRALGWKPEADFDAALAETVSWYVENRPWWEPIKSGEFKEYYRHQYSIEL
jgi:dTDP-glucose 4,6-dehydratase